MAALATGESTQNYPGVVQKLGQLSFALAPPLCLYANVRPRIITTQALLWNEFAGIVYALSFAFRKTLFVYRIELGSSVVARYGHYF